MKTLLSNLVIYRSNIQTIHWKMRGKQFLSLHKFTDKMYEEINEYIDRVIEKYVQKDIEVETTLEFFIKNASIKEELKKDMEVSDGVKKLLNDGKEILSQVENAYDNIKELGAMDLVLDDLREYLEKILWMLNKSL